MSARSRILGKVRRAIDPQTVGQGGFAARAQAALERLATRPRGTEPARNRKPQAALLDDFCARVTALSGRVQRLPSLEAIPAAVADDLRQRNLPPQVRMAPEPLLEALDWSAAPLVERTIGRPSADDSVALNLAFRGVAETGTLCLRSNQASPTTLNFLPPTHIAVLRASDLVASYEDALDAIRGENQGGLPRSVNFITGPSRTGDIEQKILLGAHGPKDLLVLVIENA